MADSPTLLWDYATALLDAAKHGMENAGFAPPARSMVAAGVNRVWDDCCPGQLTVRMSRLFLTDNFPIELQAPKPAACGGPEPAADFEVEVVACDPGNDKQGRPPPPHVVSAHAQETLLRAYAVFRGLLCWAANLAATPFDGPAIVRAMEPIGPEGGCVGYFARVTVPLPIICACEPLEEIGEGVLLPGVILG